jgi:hypothetical protein
MKNGLLKLIKSSNFEKQHKQHLEENFDPEEGLKLFQVFVCSFSINGDLLSQWRAYSPHNNGFSVGFGFTQLRNIEKAHESMELHLMPCWYEKIEHEKIVSEINDEMLREIIYCSERDMLTDLPKKFYHYYHKCALVSSILKNENFREEKEWRLVCIVKERSKNYPDVKFREGKTMLLPYLNIDLIKGANNIPIQEIYIGPTTHESLSKKSVDLLLKSKNLKCNVTPSKIPYRPLR